LIKRIVLRKTDPEKVKDPNSPEAKNLLDIWWHEFNEKLVDKFNKELLKPGHTYLTGSEISVIDIIVYCEIFQVLAMYNHTLPERMDKLIDWYEKVGAIEAVKEVSQELNQVIATHSLKDQAAQ